MYVQFMDIPAPVIGIIAAIAVVCGALLVALAGNILATRWQNRKAFRYAARQQVAIRRLPLAGLYRCQR